MNKALAELFTGFERQDSDQMVLGMYQLERLSR